jgi:superfamily II DNA helicase RecQ
MQVSVFSVAPGDSRALEEFNRFLRGHRVLTLDRHCHEGIWSFCVTWQPGLGIGGESDRFEKVDYKAVLDDKTFALFSHLRVVRKALAEKESLPPYAVFTNEQLAEVARQRCSLPGDMEKIEGIGKARVEKYSAAVLAAIVEYEKQQGAAGANRSP